ncbi:MAG: hypothetical protein CMH22_05755 [Methylophaga sp.]|nr:hypothetical protein [Methylophaga sp.]|tara:strand:+ start:92152 stop:92349 length:198 start_codon:yes stop_codon:yes gene_type:complete
MKTINLYGVELTVDYKLHKGVVGSYKTYPEPDELEIFEILHLGEDITSILSDDMIERIEDLVLED